jgi:regulator of chromosome condensation
MALAAGGNHMLALDALGRIYAWGCGQQCQLGRPILETYRLAALTPSLIRLPRSTTTTGKITSIACGQFHSFAITTTGKAFAWGLNNFGQTGIFPPKSPLRPKMKMKKSKKIQILLSSASQQK